MMKGVERRDKFVYSPRGKLINIIFLIILLYSCFRRNVGSLTINFSDLDGGTDRPHYDSYSPRRHLEDDWVLGVHAHL